MSYSEPSLKPSQTEAQSIETFESQAKTEDSMAEYYQVKQTLLLGTLIFIVVFFPLVWKFYDLNTALNYLLGGGFGLVYLNLLAKEVERIGTNKKRLGFTRLALIIGFILVASKIQQLKIIPIFLGFLTYKFTLLFYILPSSLLKGEK